MVKTLFLLENLQISGASLDILKKFKCSSAVHDIRYNCAILFSCQMYWSFVCFKYIFSWRAIVKFSNNVKITEIPARCCSIVFTKYSKFYSICHFFCKEFPNNHQPNLILRTSIYSSGMPLARFAGCLWLCAGGVHPSPQPIHPLVTTPRSTTPLSTHTPIHTSLSALQCLHTPCPSACWDTTHPLPQCMLGYTHPSVPVHAGIHSQLWT